jgi:hypothetical protein
MQYVPWFVGYKSNKKPKKDCLRNGNEHLKIINHVNCFRFISNKHVLSHWFVEKCNTIMFLILQLYNF